MNVNLSRMFFNGRSQTFSTELSEDYNKIKIFNFRWMGTKIIWPLGLLPGMCAWPPTGSNWVPMLEQRINKRTLNSVFRVSVKTTLFAVLSKKLPPRDGGGGGGGKRD